MIEYEPVKIGKLRIDLWKVDNQMNTEIFYNSYGESQKIGGGVYGDVTKKYAIALTKMRIRNGEFDYYLK